MRAPILAVALALAAGIACHSQSSEAPSGGPSARPSATPLEAAAPSSPPAALPPPGPDATAVCAAAANATVHDAWQRFGDVIPVVVGGILYVLRGAAADADAALKPMGLSSVVIVECPESLLVVWVPKAVAAIHPDAGSPLEAALARRGLRIVERVPFSQAEGRRRVEAACERAADCCRHLVLRCCFHARTEEQERACLDKARSLLDGAPCP